MKNVNLNYLDSVAKGACEILRDEHKINNVIINCHKKSNGDFAVAILQESNGAHNTIFTKDVPKSTAKDEITGSTLIDEAHMALGIYI